MMAEKQKTIIIMKNSTKELLKLLVFGFIICIAGIVLFLLLCMIYGIGA